MSGSLAEIYNAIEIPYADPAEVRASLSPNVELIIQPGIVKDWEEFRVRAPENSIAIDGYVEGPIQRDLGRRVINLNHHERVDRSSTLATCQQAVFELRRGLYETFQKDGEFQASIFMNDCDEDVCTSVFALTHPGFAAEVDNPAFNRLVDMEGLMDVTGGFYPFPAHYPSLPKFYWVYEPYSNFRNQGGLARRDPVEYAAVIREVGERIEDHITGNGSEVELDMRYEVIAQKGIWRMVRETGQHAKVGMFANGITAYTSVQELEGGRYKYTHARTQPYVPFHLIEMAQDLNELEGCKSNDQWGGGDTFCGSPRNSGSSITPEEMAEIAPRYLD